MRALTSTFPAALRDRFRNIGLALHRDYRTSIFLGGTGRSGTTWVSEFINHDNEYRDMFEPFWAPGIERARRFYYALYLRPDDDDPELIDAARRLLAGEVRHKWVDELNRNWFTGKRLVKEVRANLWLAWLRRHFPEVPIVFLMRHPCAVASSRVMLEWPTHLQQFVAQPQLIQDWLAPHMELIESTTDLFERHVLVWCIQNYIPLRQFRSDEMLPVFYERFCNEPEAEISRVFAFIGKKYDDKVLQRLDLPSRSTQHESGVKTAVRTDLAGAWRKRVNADQIAGAVRLLRAFGLDGVYNEETMPSLPGALALMNALPGST
jgi:hypothetical protein